MLFIQDTGEEAALEEVTDSIVFVIVAVGEGGAQALHETAEVGMSCMEKEVKMIGHESEGMQDNVVDATAFEENLDKEGVIII